MDRFCLPALAAVSFALLSNLPSPAQTPTDAFDNKLLVQNAVVLAQDYLSLKQPGKAVEVLEQHLARIDGNRVYLMTLRDAYAAYIRDLYFDNQEALAKKYIDRLRILDPEAAARITNHPASAPASRPVSLAALAVNSAPGGSPSLARPGNPATKSVVTARGKMSEEETLPQKQARQLLARAEAEFGQKHYGPARLLFEQAYQANPSATDGCRDRWAYCKLSYVVEQLNHNAAPGGLPELEREVQTAMTIAPQLADSGRQLLKEIAQRRQSGWTPAAPTAAESGTVAVRHYAASTAGWSVAETTYFRIYHTQTREFGEKAATVAEQTRLAMYRKWFGSDGENWPHRCDVYLHATGNDYCRVTGVPAHSPGHSRIESDQSNGRVVGRRIDLHCDNPAVLSAVLPHETTHVVLAGQFGNSPVPRWVDEGVAVLTEPAEKVTVHRQNLARFHREQGLFSVRELMQMNEYPQPARIGAFYAQSVALVDFLSRQRDPQTFCRFVRDGLREGYESALRRHYGYRDFGELQERWNQQVLAALAGGAAYAER